jgi:hypothetical protein
MREKYSWRYVMRVQWRVRWRYQVMCWSIDRDRGRHLRTARRLLASCLSGFGLIFAKLLDE